MELKNKPRKDFYAKELNMGRVEEMALILAGHLTFEEVLKLARVMAYDQVAYYGDEKGSHSRIYDEGRTDYHLEQSSVLQSELRTMCDLFGQSIGGRLFEKDHFETYIARYQLVRAQIAEERVGKLEAIIEDLRGY